MWTSQVYGHHDKMARTKTHRTSQTHFKNKRSNKCNERCILRAYTSDVYLTHNTQSFLGKDNHNILSFNLCYMYLCNYFHDIC